uniref:Uncharacterized protein n=1 Tax=Photinus pyralis TaxID=7054 RepID=A0A1Y1N8E9_PHOPY
MLHVLKLPNLPKSSRTLLQTPRETTIAKMGNGHYWHNGLEKGIVNLLPKIDSATNLELSFNIDGLPIYNSTKMEFWPILCLINNMRNLHPFVVGIYCGTTKPPSVQGFLTPFVEEIKPLLKNGIFINGIKCSLKVRCFICDTPARSFAKGKDTKV